jgi:hypothetical protein
MGVIVAVIFVLGFITFIIFIAVYASNQQKKRNQAMQDAAIEIGGRYEEPVAFGQLLANAFKGRQTGATSISELHKTPYPAIIFSFKGGSGCFTYHTSGSKNEVQYTDIILMLEKPLGFGLKITPEGFFSKIGKAFGMQDMQLGDLEFDSKYIIKSDNETALLNLLTPNLKRLIVEMHEYKFKNIDFQVSEHIEIHKIGFIQEKEEIKQYIDLSKQIVNEFLPKGMNF